jgi:hypothetical protein
MHDAAKCLDDDATRRGLFTSPRRGEVDAQSASGEGISEPESNLRDPLTPTLSPLGRGSANAVPS